MQPVRVSSLTKESYLHPSEVCPIKPSNVPLRLHRLCLPLNVFLWKNALRAKPMPSSSEFSSAHKAEFARKRIACLDTLCFTSEHIRCCTSAQIWSHRNSILARHFVQLQMRGLLQMLLRKAIRLLPSNSIPWPSSSVMYWCPRRLVFLIMQESGYKADRLGRSSQ